MNEQLQEAKAKDKPLIVISNATLSQVLHQTNDSMYLNLGPDRLAQYGENDLNYYAEQPYK
jgi:hypothetical protein